MLRPDERSHLMQLLRPPAGCKFSLAVGTTFSLDLISALMLPLSFAFFDLEQADGELVAIHWRCLKHCGDMATASRYSANRDKSDCRQSTRR